MKKKISICLTLALGIIATFSIKAFATDYVSRTYIQASNTGRSGNPESMIGLVNCRGDNYISSKNKLWLVFRDSSNRNIHEAVMSIGGSASFSDTVSGGVYHIWLDPDGTWYTNCEGYGEARNSR